MAVLSRRLLCIDENFGPHRYFGKSLSDEMAAASPEAAAEPVPMGLVHSSIGGTTIQQWMPPWTTGNDTCADNNCGLSEQLDPRNPVQPSTLSKCNASQSTVWSCPSGHCSDLWHGMIAPWLNMTITGAIWYQVRGSCVSVLYLDHIIALLLVLRLRIHLVHFGTRW
eukprot:COSAG06_NODE_1866_length_8190_cov_144.750463_8_plen_167_part_00